SGSGFAPPALSDFQVLSGPNQSSSMEWINGRMSSSISFSYILMAVKEGEFTIGPARIRTEDGVVSTRPIKITVIKGASVQQQQQQQVQPPTADEGKMAKEVFIRLVTDKSTAYLGEKIYATYKLYYRVNIVDYNLDKLPASKGFWSEEIKLPQNIRPKSENINGVVYNTAVFKKAILFPQATGNLKLEPLAIDLVLRVRDRGRQHSIFDQFFGSYRDVKYTAKSNSKTIRVLPLPSKGKPMDFKGAVGKFSMNAVLDKSDVKENDAINLKLTISGNGNIKLIQDPDISFPPDFEVYDPKVKDNFNTSAAGISGSRTYEYLIIPRVAGQYTIDPVAFSYFNPSTKSYTQLHTGSFAIEVRKGDGQEVSSFHSVSKEDLKVLGKDIRFIHTGPQEFKRKGEHFFNSNAFYGALASPLLCFLLFFFVRKKYLGYISDTRRMKRMRATRWAKKRLSKASACLKKDEPTQFYEEISLALYGYIGDKLGIDAAQMGREKIEEELAKRKVMQETVNRLFNTLDLCEQARFSPLAHHAEKEIYDNALQILGQIGKEIK
ncbi:MAG: BatD family protein, partial [Flavobacteriales bacterium]